MLITAAQALHAGLTALLVALTAAFVVCCLVPWLHSPLRALLRPFVIHHVEGGLPWVAAAQRLQRPWLTILFQQSSHVVSVGFYATFLPVLLFVGLSELAWHLVALMTLTLYVGNSMKDLVCAPRPINVSYGKERLRFLGGTGEEVEKNSQEYGLPSSHTMNSIVLNFYLIRYLHSHSLLGAPAAGAAYAAAAAWTLWVAASRIYLGLHTPIDIIAGAVAGAAVLSAFLALEGAMTWWVRSQPPGAVIAQHLLASLVLLRLCPRPLSYTPSFEFTTSFFGAFFGGTAGVARTYSRFYAVPIQLAGVWSHGPAWVARRVALGLAIVVACKEASRAFFLAALPPLYTFFPLRARRLWQPPVHNLAPPGAVADSAMRPLPHSAAGRPFDVDVTARFFAYAGIGYAVMELAPRAFAALGW